MSLDSYIEGLHDPDHPAGRVGWDVCGCCRNVFRPRHLFRDIEYVLICQQCLDKREEEE